MKEQKAPATSKKSKIENPGNNNNMHEKKGITVLFDND